MTKVYSYKFRSSILCLIAVTGLGIYYHLDDGSLGSPMLYMSPFYLLYYGFTICRVETNDHSISAKSLIGKKVTHHHDEVSSYQVAYRWFSKKQKIKSITLTMHDISKDQITITPAGTQNFAELST